MPTENNAVERRISGHKRQMRFAERSLNDLLYSLNNIQQIQML